MFSCFSVLLSLFLFVFASSAISAKEEIYRLAISEGEPSSFVEDCVSTLSGEYFINQQDMIVAGVEPIPLQRLYISGRMRKIDGYDGDYWRRSWTFINHLTITNDLIDGLLYIPERSGTVLRYIISEVLKNTKHAKKGKLSLLNSDYEAVLSNSSHGEISARYNLRNNVVTSDAIEHTVFIQSADGSERLYKAQKGIVAFDPFTEKGDGEQKLALHSERLPNGNKLLYFYGEKNELKEIRSTSHDEKKTYAWARWHHVKNSLYDISFDIETSDERCLQYRDEPYKEKRIKPTSLLKQITGPEIPQETLRYHPRKLRGGPVIHYRDFPKQRSLNIEYYEQEHNDVGGVDIFIKDKHDPRMHRVKYLRAPVGEDANLHITHRFFYNVGEYGKSDSCTDVFDVYDNKTTYRFTPKFRLSEINWHTENQGNQEFHHGERAAWGPIGPIKGDFLQAKSLIDKDQKPLFSRQYCYDEIGNIQEEKFYGNLSGTCAQSLTLNAQHLPNENGVECYKKHNTYSKDGKNLLIKQEEDNGTFLEFTYHANTDRIAAKFLCSGVNIHIRHFFEYDADLILVREIVDDGNTYDKNNLSGVTERRIKVITPRRDQPYIGMPDTIEEKYLDLSTHQEKLLKKTQLTYTKGGKVTKQDIYDATNTYRYSLSTKFDDMGHPYLETNALGQEAKSTYDECGNKITYKDFSGKITKTMHYDFSNRLIHVEEKGLDGISHVISHRYDKKHNRIATQDIFGNKTEYTYDAFGNNLLTRLPATCNTSGESYIPHIYFSYDSAGRKISETNPKNESTYTRYNAYSKPIEILYPDQYSEKFIYNLDGTLQCAFDKEGNYTTHAYDYLGRETQLCHYSAKDELLSTAIKEYSAFHLISTTDPEGNTTYYTYDGAGRKKTEECRTLAGLEKLEYTYDALGNLFCVKKSDGKHTLSTITLYDLLQRLIEERAENEQGKLLSKTTYEYDSAGNKKIITRWLENKEIKELFFYDSFNRPTKQIDALGAETHISYDENYQNALGQRVLRKIHTDPLGIQTIEIYSALGKVVSTEKRNTFAQVLSHEEFFYDERGNLSRQLSTLYPSNSAPLETLWEYGTNGKLLTLTEAAGTPEQKTTRYTHTPKGLIDETHKPDGVIVKRIYDALGRMIQLTSSDNSISYSYHYNLLGQQLSSKNLLTGSTTTRIYDQKGRLYEETLAHGLRLQNQYDLRGRRTQLTLHDKSSIAYNYDALYLRSVSRFSTSSDLLYTHHYTHYDLSGHLLEQELIADLGTATFSIDAKGRTTGYTSPFGEERVTEFSPNGNIRKIAWNQPFRKETTHYSYDDLSQLTQETGLFAHTFAYDSHYNRLRKDNDIYKINALHQLKKTHDTEFTYDPNGNPTLKKTAQTQTHFIYDALDRLIEVFEPGLYRLSFTYDTDHRRLTKTTFLWKQGKWQQDNLLFFLYDHQNEIGATDSSGKIIQLRVLGSTPQAEIGAAIALELHDTTYAPLHDLHGNLTALISTKTHQLAEPYAYSAFGEEIIFSPSGNRLTHTSIDNPWRYSSKRIDEESKLIYYGRRFYDPHLGRWLTPDPQGFTESLNLYAFVLNDPLTHLDLYGLEAQSAHFREYFAPFLWAGKQILNLIGRTIFNFFHHFIPITPYCQAGKGVGQLFAPDIIDPTTKSQIGKVDKGRQFKTSSHVYTGGVGNSLEDTLANASLIANGLNANVHYVHNNTYGLLRDCGEALVEKTMDIATHPVRLLVETTRARIAEHGGTDSKATIHWWLHSEGGAIGAAALNQLTPTEKKMISAHTFGSASLFDGKGLKEVQHYISTHDPIPMIDLFRYTKALFSDNTNVKFLKSENRLFDHSFQGNTYQSKIRKITSDIRNAE